MALDTQEQAHSGWFGSLSPGSIGEDECQTGGWNGWTRGLCSTTALVVGRLRECGKPCEIVVVDDCGAVG